VADETRVVQKLGKFPLPVEVIHFALPLVTCQLKDLGLNPVLRAALNGAGPWLTDEGNVILLPLRIDRKSSDNSERDSQHRARRGTWIVPGHGIAGAARR
jgi:ribose 5-phosphate isomerase